MTSAVNIILSLFRGRGSKTCRQLKVLMELELNKENINVFAQVSADLQRENSGQRWVIYIV